MNAPHDETRGEQRDDGPDPRDETDDAPRDDTGGALRDGVRLAWGTLTAIPGPAPLRVDAAVARVAMAGAWLVVLPLTLACALTGWVLVLLGVPATAAGFLTIGALSWATRRTVPVSTVVAWVNAIRAASRCSSEPGR